MSPFNHESGTEAGKKGGKVGGKAQGFCKVRGVSQHYRDMVNKRWEKQRGLSKPGKGETVAAKESDKS
jgi:hypothetical protein